MYYDYRNIIKFISICIKFINKMLKIFKELWSVMVYDKDYVNN